MEKKIYELTATTDENDVSRKFECGLMNLILTVAGKIKEEEINMSELNFNVTIYVNKHSRSDIGIHRISINHYAGYNSVVIKIDGTLDRIFSEKFFNLSEVKREDTKTWYCPIQRIETIKSVKEILNHFSEKKI